MCLGARPTNGQCVDMSRTETWSPRGLLYDHQLLSGRLVAHNYWYDSSICFIALPFRRLESRFEIKRLQPDRGHGAAIGQSLARGITLGTEPKRNISRVSGRMYRLQYVQFVSVQFAWTQIWCNMVLSAQYVGGQYVQQYDMISSCPCKYWRCPLLMPKSGERDLRHVILPLRIQRAISYHITQYNILSISYHVTPHYIISYINSIISYHAVPYHRIIAHYVIPYHFTPYHIISYHILRNIEKKTKKKTDKTSNSSVGLFRLTCAKEVSSLRLASSLAFSILEAAELNALPLDDLAFLLLFVHEGQQKK